MRYLAVEDHYNTWLVVDTKYPRGRKPNSKEIDYDARVVQSDMQEHFAKTLVKSLNEEEARHGT